MSQTLYKGKAPASRNAGTIDLITLHEFLFACIPSCLLIRLILDALPAERIKKVFLYYDLIDAKAWLLVFGRSQAWVHNKGWNAHNGRHDKIKHMFKNAQKVRHYFAGASGPDPSFLFILSFVSASGLADLAA